MPIRPLRRISASEREAILEELKGFFHLQEDIVFALLYGSMVSPEIHEKYGDIDLAVYVKAERLKEPEHFLESKMEIDLFRRLVHKGFNPPPIEVLTLNHAPYSFSSKLLKGKYIILKEDEEALTDFIEEVGRRSMINHHLRFESLQEVIGV